MTGYGMYWVTGLRGHGNGEIPLGHCCSRSGETDEFPPCGVPISSLSVHRP
jgi:hypothetical protein